MNRLLTLNEVQEITSLSRATINRYRQIGDFPDAIQVTSGRVVFSADELNDWIETRPRKSGPEVYENRRSVRAPATPEELDRLRRAECAEFKTRIQGSL